MAQSDVTLNVLSLILSFSLNFSVVVVTFFVFLLFRFCVPWSYSRYHLPQTGYRKRERDNDPDFVPHALHPKHYGPTWNPLQAWKWCRPTIDVIVNHKNDTDYELYRTRGMDVLMYTRFTRMCLDCCGVCFVVGLAPLIANAASGDGAHAGLAATTGLELMTLANVAPNAGVLWLHTLYAYFVTGFILVCLVREWRVYTFFRRMYIRDSNNSRNFTVLLTDLPGKHGSTREEVERALRPLTRIAAPAQSAGVGASDPSEEPEVSSPVIVTLVPSGSEVRQVMALKGRRAEAARQLARAMHLEATRHDTMKPDADVVTQKVGGLPLLSRFTGTTVPAVSYWTEQLQELDNQLAEAFKSPTLIPARSTAAYVTFGSRRLAGFVPQLLVQHTSLNWTCSPAPEREDCLFDSTVTTSVTERFVRTALARTLLFFLFVFWNVPVAFIASITNINSLAKVKGFEWMAVKDEVGAAFLQAYLPPVGLLVLAKALGWTLRKITVFERLARSKTDLTVMVLNKVVLYLFVNVVFTSAIGGAVFHRIKELSEEPGRITTILGMSMPATSSFFIYLTLTATGNYALDILNLPNVCVDVIRRKWMCKTPGELANALQPEPFKFAQAYANKLMFFSIFAIFAPIAPLVVAFTFFFFLVSRAVDNYNFAHVSRNPNEGGGAAYVYVLRWSFVSVLMSHLTTVGVMSLKEAKSEGPFLLLLPIFTLVVWHTTERLYYRSSLYPSLFDFTPAHTPDNDTELAVLGGAGHESVGGEPAASAGGKLVEDAGADSDGAGSAYSWRTTDDAELGHGRATRLARFATDFRHPGIVKADHSASQFTPSAVAPR